MIARDSFRRKVVVSKYGEEDPFWLPKTISTSHGVGVWKGIRKGWDVFQRHIQFEIGEGSFVRFWKHKWCGDEELWKSFPNLFDLATNKDAMVSSILHLEGGNATWNPTFRRNVQGWEMESVVQFFDKLYSQQVGSNSADQILWKGSKANKFTVRSFYIMLVNNNRNVFPWRLIWKSRAPVEFLFLLGRFLTKSFLWGRTCGSVI